MRQLTDLGRTATAEIARRHGVGTDAVVTLLEALEVGGGSQAQFSHPDLGGMGQWSRHGMIMVGDMFNNGLKARVDALCLELSELMRDHDLFKPGPGFGSRSSSQSGSWSTSSAGAWWPEGCGTPSSTGSANDTRYAFFPDTRRLAILRDGELSLYDTGDHRIHGVSSQQQNGGSADIKFSSQHGPVRLHELTRLGNEAQPSSARAATSDPAAPRSWSSSSSYAGPQPGSSQRAAPAQPAERHAPDDDVLAKIERLHELQQKGVLSDSEFAEKKKELLARI